MLEIINKEDCCGCSACSSICPNDAIQMLSDEKGFKYPIINKEKCINCNLCKKVCPIINKKNIKNNPKAYACYNKNDLERLQSSSGGIFSLIAKEILKRNGIVIGAALDKNFVVNHIYIDNEKGLKLLRTSKYVQSNIGNMYVKAKEFLEQGKYVLFTGTPCQIEGLTSFLRKDYDKLYLQDIICHGVPSPLVWEKYKKYRVEVDKGNLKDINFRNKDNGWKKFNLKFIYNDKEYKRSQQDDFYMKTFLSNVILRDSCYHCSFKKEHRISDITLADFWGIENILPHMFDDKGTSLVIVNSSKGNELFDSICENIIMEEILFQDAIKYNKNMTSSVSKNSNRENFFKDLDKLSYDKLTKKYVDGRSLTKKIKRTLRRMMKKV